VVVKLKIRLSEKDLRVAAYEYVRRNNKLTEPSVNIFRLKKD
jgi:hypothetical protein